MRPDGADWAAWRLLEQILARYGSLEAFCTRLRHDLDDPTIELPPIAEVRPSLRRWA